MGQGGQDAAWCQTGIYMGYSSSLDVLDLNTKCSILGSLKSFQSSKEVFQCF